MFTPEQQRDIRHHFEQAWGDTVAYLPPGTNPRSAAVDIIRDYALDRAGIDRVPTEEEDQWLVATAEEYA